MSDEIHNVEISLLSKEDYNELKAAMITSYPNIPNAFWKEDQIQTLLDKFPEGQVTVKVNGRIAGCVLSIVVLSEQFDKTHTYKSITGNYTFNTHNDEGDVLYGIDVFVLPEFRGLRLGRRLYDYRKELCENLNLSRIVFGGRIPNYHEYADEITPRQYIERVKNKEIYDPVLNFQMSNDFHPVRVLKGYLEDRKSVV